MARTKRNRKLEKRRHRDVEREMARRVADGEPVVAIKTPDTKVRPGLLSLGQRWTPEVAESSFARRLRDARRLLGLPDGLPPSK